MKTGKFRSLRNLICMVAFAVALTSCEKVGDGIGNDDDDNPASEKNGYAPETAKGHTFSFYHNSGNWHFSALVNQKEDVTVTFPENGWMLAREYEPSFGYYKKSKDEANVLVFITLKIRLSSDWVYNYKYYSGHYLLKFTSEKKGTFSWYDNYSDLYSTDPFPAKILIATGTFKTE